MSPYPSAVPPPDPDPDEMTEAEGRRLATAMLLGLSPFRRNNSSKWYVESEIASPHPVEQKNRDRTGSFGFYSRDQLVRDWLEWRLGKLPAELRYDD